MIYQRDIQKDYNMLLNEILTSTKKLMVYSGVILIFKLNLGMHLFCIACFRLQDELSSASGYEVR